MQSSSAVWSYVSDWFDTEYNTDDSLLPFYLPLALWLAAYGHCVLRAPPQRRDYHRWHALHNLHNGGAIVLASLSLYYASGGGVGGSGNNAAAGTPATTGSTTGYSTTSSPTGRPSFHFNERIPILWSLGYFAVDCIDCCVRRDATYLLHAVCCAGLGLANYRTPVLRRLRMNSKAAYCELSSPFMHLAKMTRDPLHFALFAVVFTCCRMLWLPVMYRQLLAAGMPWNDGRMLVFAAFYGLNAYWYAKILRILYKGARGNKPDKDE